MLNTVFHFQQSLTSENVVLGSSNCVGKTRGVAHRNLLVPLLFATCRELALERVETRNAEYRSGK